MIVLRLSTILFVATLAAAFSPSRLTRSVSRSHCDRAPFSCPSPSCLFSETNSSSNDFDDFAEFSTTQLTSSNDDARCDDSFLSSLQSRVQQVEDESNKLPLMVLDTMLPRQILQIQIQHPTLKSLMKRRVGQETPTLGMLGKAKLSTGQLMPLNTGVEVHIVQMEKAVDDTPADTSRGEEESWDVSLRAGRRFVVDGEAEKAEGGWTEARVKFLDSSVEEKGELQVFSEPSMEVPSGLSSVGDRLSVARAISLSKQFTEPNASMKNSASLVDTWVELAKVNERRPGQIEALLQQLGEMPPEYEPTERAFWVGALINPLPSMGVAMEIRPALLVSKRAEERVQVALDGIMKSIRHMDGSAPMW